MAAVVAPAVHPRGGGRVRVAREDGGATAAPPPSVAVTGPFWGRGGVPPAAHSPAAGLPTLSWPAPYRRGGRWLSRRARGAGAVAVAVLALTLLVLAAFLGSAPGLAAAKFFPEEASVKPSVKKWVPKKPACSPDKCMTEAKVELAVKNAKLGLEKKEKVEKKHAAGIAKVIRAGSTRCMVGGKPVSPPTLCFKDSAEEAVGAAYAKLLRAHGKHVTKSTKFGAKSNKGLTGCSVCEPYYFPFGDTCCYVGCRSMVNLVGSSTIFLHGCCTYLRGRCEKTARTLSSTSGSYWSGF